jgi:hypothetical protein
MKKVSMLLFVFLLGVCVKGFPQTTAGPDFFAGPWEITIVGAPNGDVKFLTDLTRKDGKLTGELKDPEGTKPATPITSVEEQDNTIVIHFDNDQVGDIGIRLAKVDDDHLKGEVMMFEATAVRKGK